MEKHEKFKDEIESAIRLIRFGLSVELGDRVIFTEEDVIEIAVATYRDAVAHAFDEYKTFKEATKDIEI